MTAPSLPPEEHPRPQLRREHYRLLDTDCGFGFDDDDSGLAESWFLPGHLLPLTIRLPFPPESAASGVGDTGRHPIVWYRLEFGPAELAEAGWPGRGRLLLHLGAVDHRADVWVNGQHVGSHEGGQASFSFDITDRIGADGPTIVTVRAQDDPDDVTRPRGKQDWRDQPHSIWYHRSTGIWRSVWLEAVPETFVRQLTWRTHPERATASLRLVLNRRPEPGASVSVTLRHGDQVLAKSTTDLLGDGHPQIELVVPFMRNGQAYDELLWSPEHPTLWTAAIDLSVPGGATDSVSSYLGFRTVAVRRSTFLLNDRPYHLRGVLEQGYWPDSLYTAPGTQALRAEVELIKSLGFNLVRIHQKTEDPRFHYWCDRLGLLVWGETASPYEFSEAGAAALVREWTEIVQQYASHPSIITWVPVNESWGVQHISHDPAQAALSRALADLTRALDPTRPVISNDGWEHTASDLLTIHDYASSPAQIAARYAGPAEIRELVSGIGPFGRALTAADPDIGGLPVILSEFGGIHYEVDAGSSGWGYSEAADAGDFLARIAALMDAVHAAGGLAGYCYTQLTDTAQEKNGICDEHRRPKADPTVLRSHFHPG